MAIETYLNSPPLRGRDEGDEAFLERVVGWIGNTEVHGNEEDKKLARVTKADIPELLATGRRMGLTGDEVAESIMLVDGVRSRVFYDMQTTVARMEMEKRAAEHRKRQLRNV